MEIGNENEYCKDNGDEITNVKDDSGKGSIHGGYTPTIALAPEKQALFERRFEEGYDLYDAEYDQWLRVCNPEANVNTSY